MQLCRKNIILFGIRIYFQVSRKNGSYELTLLIQSENYFSPYGCQRADSCSLFYCVTYSALSVIGPAVAKAMAGIFHCVENGGPGWTRTSDPTLIKRVL